MIQQSKAKVPFYRPEYAWYLDREMIVANAWMYDSHFWAASAKIDDIAERTAEEVQILAQTGRFWYYFIPAREEYRFDPLAGELKGQQMAQILPNFQRTYSAEQTPESMPYGPWDARSRGVASLTVEELDRRLNDHDRSDDTSLYWEKHRRYREAVIARLKDLYYYEYYDNHAMPGDEDFCYYGNTPCYLFDLLRPK